MSMFSLEGKYIYKSEIVNLTHLFPSHDKYSWVLKDDYKSEFLMPCLGQYISQSHGKVHEHKWHIQCSQAVVPLC